MSSFDRHVHDCDCCKFCGSFPYGAQVMDVYNHQNETVIMRYGSRAEKYQSFPIVVARAYATDSRLWAAGVVLFDLRDDRLVS